MPLTGNEFLDSLDEKMRGSRMLSLEPEEEILKFLTQWAYERWNKDDPESQAIFDAVLTAAEKVTVAQSKLYINSGSQLIEHVLATLESTLPEPAYKSFRVALDELTNSEYLHCNPQSSTEEICKAMDRTIPATAEDCDYTMRLIASDN